jgi:hypothetical protein
LDAAAPPLLHKRDIFAIRKAAVEAAFLFSDAHRASVMSAAAADLDHVLIGSVAAMVTAIFAVACHRAAASLMPASVIVIRH